MILVLSCSDLTVVTIIHPLLIVSTIYFFQGEINEIRIRLHTDACIYFVVCFSSLFALFTLNVERFLALTRPFFHQASVTKTRLLCFQAFWTVIVVGISPLVYFNSETIVAIFASVTVLSLLFLFIYSNYKIFIIAKSKRADERVAPTTSMDENRKKRILNLKIFLRVLWQLAVFSVVFARPLYILLYVSSHQERRCLRGKFCYFLCGQARLLL
jgi:hypothetical protein